MRGSASLFPLPAKGGQGVGPAISGINMFGVTHPNPSLGREGFQ
jgi:hypothetical protein